MSAHQHQGHLIVTDGDGLDEAHSSGRWIASDLVVEVGQ